MEDYRCFCIFSSIIIVLSIKLSIGADIITPSTLIHDGEKLVSSSEMFELGFFSPGKSKNKYLGIWFKKSPDTIVWVANRISPFSDPNAVLTVSNDGKIVLLNNTNGTIWSSNTSTKAENPVAQLLDTGNLVVVDNFSRNNNTNTSENILWQSFDYPTDTSLAGMKFGWDLKTGVERRMTSWRSDEDPSPGNFSYRLGIHVLPQFFLYGGSEKLARYGPWDGEYLGGASPSYANFLFNVVVEENENEVYGWYESYNTQTLTMLKLYPSGKFQRLIWNERNESWEVVFIARSDVCENYGNCGANSICSPNRSPNCECLKGFKLQSQDNNQTWPGTCVRSSSQFSDCQNGQQFMKFEDMILPDLLEVSLNRSMNLKECESECWKNCSCRAYSNSDARGGGSGCLMWFGDLIDMRDTSGNLTTGLPIYIRVPASEPEPEPERGNKKLLWMVVIVVIPIALLALCIFRRWNRKHKDKETMNVETNKDLLSFDINMSFTTSTNEIGESDGDAKEKNKECQLPLFSLASVAAATDDFSVQCKLGQGGFGPVYKGRLHNGQEVAVKRLSSQSGQGQKEFKNEMMVIAKLQHRNLVRLLGCCIDQGEKILIYEYMPNKSLDVFLFHPENKGVLDWQARVRIIEGIAQGLLYLHQYSRLRIIHRDLKASNILLDSDMNPKISDFGMARIFDSDELQGNTKRIVGTYGYMSPEYALQGHFSIKSDVFSFGVLMLETLTSKRITGICNTDSFNLLGHTWDLWNGDRAYELIDPELQIEIPRSIRTRYVNVALLCVQENAADRPTMLEVFSMITNELYNLPHPKKPAFLSQPNKGTSEVCSVNDVSVSLINPR